MGEGQRLVEMKAVEQAVVREPGRDDLGEPGDIAAAGAGHHERQVRRGAPRGANEPRQHRLPGDAARAVARVELRLVHQLERGLVVPTRASMAAAPTTTA